MSHLFLTAVGGDPTETVQLDQNSNLTVGAQDVLVAVDAAPINPADLLFTLGWFGVYPQVPNALGAEGTGRVLQAGTAADPNLVGRRVIILPTFVQGTWADKVVVPAQNVVAVTEKADPVQLAMLPVNPATAYALLNDYADLKPGDWIGLNLANSGVGQYVITLAKRRGIKTLAVVRREGAAKRVRELGADLVVIEGADLGDRVATALGDNKLRLLFEGAGGPEQVGELIRSVEAGGSVVTFSAVTGQSPVVPLGDLIYRGISVRAFFILNWIRDTPRPELERIYTELADLVAEGAISATVEATYPLDRYREALAHAGQQERSGKILFTPDRQTA
ncbi:zinc-dependent alcohol dehydrogenase family protein [Micromonospora sp. NPDC050417]|uniref:zinc-dependent alcohol dehydrogenase family protein n=1 Tax=Micromonospora sp. NPDC050417 TaxID=3364280 RepID=UPI0037BC25BF